MNRNHRGLSRLRFIVLFAVIGAACSKGDVPPAGAAAGSDAGATVAEASSVETQPSDVDPCTWMNQQEVEGIIGKLERAPFRNDDDQSVDPQPDGEVCAYVVVPTRPGAIPGGVFVEVATHDGAQLTAGVMAALRSVADWLPAGYNPGDTGVAGPWDHAAGSGKRLFAARQGDAAVVITGIGYGVPKEQLGAIAAKVLAKIPDLPTAAPPIRAGVDPEEEPVRDPCSLVTAQEAEKVVGKLAVAPYRSRTTTSMASAKGGSCSYRTPKHRVLILTPSWEGGQMQLKIAAITAQQTAKILGGTSAADTLEGEWDQVAGGPSGEMYFLKGDALLEVRYDTSSTDIAGAVTLARIALGRF